MKWLKHTNTESNDSESHDDSAIALTDIVSSFIDLIPLNSVYLS